MGPINRKYLSFLLILLTLGSLFLVACGSSGKRETEPAERPVPETTESSVETALPAEPPVTHESIEEEIVVERDGVLIRVKSLDFSNPGGPALIYEIENKTPDAIGAFFYAVSVNGIMIPATFTHWEGPAEEDPHEYIRPGELAKLDLIFPFEALQRALIETIQEIEFSLYILDSETRINLVDAHGILVKTKSDPSYVQTYDEEGILVLDSDDMKIVARDADTFPGPDQTLDPSLSYGSTSRTSRMKNA